ncbi:MAG: DNA polymerase III subunit gamma/tau [Gammaproteobacteria bacterium]|nr:DNA polymerase III subunit gamma/tau [Gammaproteobacteria bacterium]
MYQVLARKYRPRNFAELVGQTHVSRALGSALERGRLHHAYLFTGTRGVGKTTIARILSKCLNCETGITATPCGVCGTCRAIDEGRFIDLIEIDAASRTKVEDTRELLDNVPYAPTQGRYKVYLIDEVHMLSTHSFNALLKTLEEPPEHVKFLLATTDPQKLPVTVLSRCLQFTLRPLPRQEIHDHLAEVLKKESITFDDAALWLLAESAQGSLRDAMSLTDQAIAYGQGSVQGEDVQAMLGLLDRSQVANLLLAIHQRDSQLVAKILFDLSQQAVDVSAVLDQMITLLHQVALAQLLPQQADIGTPTEVEILKKMASNFDRQDVQLYYQIALQGRADLKLAVTAQQGFEMCVLRLLAFRPLGLHETNSNYSAIQHSTPELEFNIKNQSQETQSPETQSKKNSESLIEAESVTETISAPIVDEPIIDVPQEEILSSVEDEILPSDFSNNEAELEDEPVYVQAAEIIAEEAEPLAAEDASLDDRDEEEINHHQDMFALESTQTESVESEQITAPQSVVEEEPVLETVAVEAKEKNVAEVRSTNISYGNDSTKTPFEILAHPYAELSGDWTAEKWEYWLRERAQAGVLSGGELSLGQHGLMRGEIGGKVEFVIAAEHRVLTSQMLDGLLAALKADWPKTQLEIVHATPIEITPVKRKEARIVQAEVRARELLVSDPAIEPLMKLFDAEVVELEMKEA